MHFNRKLELPFGGYPLTGWRKVFAWTPIHTGRLEWSWLCFVWRRRIGAMQLVTPNPMVVPHYEYTYEHRKVVRRRRARTKQPYLVCHKH